MPSTNNSRMPEHIGLSPLRLTTQQKPFLSFNEPRPRIIIFIGSLGPGGKERRLVELLTYLKPKNMFDFLVVVTKDDVHYQSFYELDIPYIVIDKVAGKKNLSVFFQFYNICKKYRPHMIHTWGRVQTFYTVPSVFLQTIPLVNSQITSAPPSIKKWSVDNFIDKINFFFSSVILANSKAGIKAYNPPVGKLQVIYNGINMNRFIDLPSKELVRLKYGISTPFVVLMAASFTNNKDYFLFYRIAEKVLNTRNDITFIGVGGYGHDDTQYRTLVNISRGKRNILFPGRINDVEALINVCTVGVLFSNKEVHGEGISNSVMEYMSLSKPVIANDAGGTNEIVHHNENGYLITDQSEEEIAALLTGLIDDEKKLKAFGERSRNIINEHFSLETMGAAFEKVYKTVVGE